MSTIQTLVSTAKVLVSVITSVSLLLPPSLITDTESASDGNCLLGPYTILNVIANNAKTIDLISILNHLTIITANKDRLNPT